MELESQLAESQAISKELEATTTELEERTKEAEAAEIYSRGIIDSISDPFAVLDADWRFRYLNAAAAAEVAQSPSHEPTAMIGRVVWDAFPQLVGTAFERGMRRAATERVPVKVEAFYAERGTWGQRGGYPLPGGA